MILVWYVLILLLSFYALARVCDVHFIKSLDLIGKKRKLEDSVAWATLMAIGTSAPEFVTASLALFEVESAIGAWTIIWSAIFNLFIIVWWSALIAQGRLNRRATMRDIVFYGVAIAVLAVTFRDGRITLVESVWYIVTYIMYLLYLTYDNKKQSKEFHESVEQVQEEEELVESRYPILRVANKLIDACFPNLNRRPGQLWLSFWISIVGIIILSKVMIEGAVGIASFLGISPVIIALTILAWWTSIPDLLASLSVAKHGRIDMAVSNALGSNTFDILLCLGLPRMIAILITQQSIQVSTDNLLWSIVLLFGTVLVMLAFRMSNGFRLTKWVGRFFIFLYIGYVGYNIRLTTL